MFWRIIICTSANAGDGGNAKILDAQKECLKQKEKGSLTKKSRLRNPLLMGLGAFVGLGLVVLGNLNSPQAQAATLAENLDLAKQVVASVAPVVAPTQIATAEATTDSAYSLYAPDGFISKPLVADTQITETPQPVIARPAVAAPAPRRVAATNSAVSTARIKVDVSGGNHFPYGYCTYYVANRRNVPWFGNAGTWLSGARAAGYATGSAPKAGAIMVTSESPIGHVAYVESVNGNGTITVSEMNYTGFGRISSRTISANSGFIKGFIY